MGIRKFTPEDIPALQKAIDADTFHPGEWKVWHFQIPFTVTKVFEDSQGPVIFILYTNDDKRLRISCVWADANDTRRNARAVFYTLRDAAQLARERGDTSVVVETEYPKLADFLTKVFKMERCGNDYVLPI